MAKERPVRERDRYARASLREQAGDVLTELRAHPGVTAIIVVILGGWLFFLVTRPTYVQVGGLAVGDCLYVHAPDADTDSPTGRPAGTATGAVAGLYDQGAERAGCGASHSHEVIVTFRSPGEPGTPHPGTAGLAEPWAGPCDDAFEAWVGVPPAGSELEVVIAVPNEPAWTGGERAGACLVARADGQFMQGPAKGFGR